MDIPLRILRAAVKVRRIIRVINPLSFLVNIKTRFVKFWRVLNFAQRCYFISVLVALLLMFNLEEESSADPLFAISLLFAVVALLVEFWPKFVIIWHHLLGKTIIVIFYAIMANFALASAAGMVNEVAGVSSNILPYSHNMALILNIPTWFMLTSVLALVVIQLFIPFYLILLLLLKPFGLHGIWHQKEYRFVFTTAMIRYIWCSVLLITTVVLSINNGFINHTTPVFGSVVEGFVSGHKYAKAEGSSKKDVTSINDIVELKDDKAKSIEEKLDEVKDDTPSFLSVNLADDDLSNQIYQKSLAVELTLKKLLAEFIYYYETDSYSRCEHPENTKVVELNDYQLLLMQIDENEAIGYKFTVIACNSPGIGSNN